MTGPLRAQRPPLRARAAMTVAVAAALAIAAPAAPARAEPSDRALVATGLALAPPTYLLGVTLHEGSHALAAKLLGADVLSVRLFPPGRDPRANTFRFGWTYVRGLRSKSDRLWFYLAPKLTNTLLLGGFAALVLTDAWPSNAYAQLGLTVLGTGLWVDFAKDVVVFKRSNDVVKALDLWCMRGWRQLPARLIYAGMIAGWGLAVARGYQRTFAANDAAAPRIVPLLSGGF